MEQFLTEDKMFEIVTKHDPRFDGVFFFGAFDSGIYCIPSCRVRTPLYRNVRFYYTPEEAESEGRRLCQRCRPDLVRRKDLADVWYH